MITGAFIFIFVLGVAATLYLVGRINGLNDRISAVRSSVRLDIDNKLIGFDLDLDNRDAELKKFIEATYAHKRKSRKVALTETKELKAFDAAVATIFPAETNEFFGPEANGKSPSTETTVNG